jgi:hypothetical protein
MAAVAEPADHNDFVTAGLYAILTYIAPHKALAKQKRWMRRNCRKPTNMSVRECTNNLRRINERELCKLPPFGADQILTGDELTDIVLHGVPRSWPREMEKQGFDPDTKTLVEIIQFCERMEEAEDFGVGRDAQKTKTTHNKVKHDKVKGDKKEKPSSSGDHKYCLLHGDNHTHNSDECHVLVKRVQAMRRSDGDKRKPSHKKPWNRDAAKGNGSSKKELAAFVRKTARKELHAFTKRRKTSASSKDEDTKSVSSSGGELDLSSFDYDEMDKLAIDSDEAKQSSEDGSYVSV